MPISVSLQKRTVILNEETRFIIECYRESLEEVKGQGESESGSRSDADLGSIESSRGFWAKYVATTVEAITEELHGSKIINLPEPDDIELETPAEILLRSYLRFLNEMLIAEKVDAKNAKVEPINSKYVLVYELLYRLVCISLCNKLDYNHDGEKLAKALRSFIRKMTERDLLLNGYGKKEISPFLTLLSTSHPKWISYIEQMVRTIKLIRSNSRVISHILNRLRKSEQIIQMQLIAFINPEENENNLAAGWLDTTLERCERLYFKVSAPEIGNVVSEELNIVVRQQSILSRLRSFPESRRERITKLYELLNRNHFLYEMISHLDLLITYTGWVSILVGVIDFNKLKNLIGEYAQNANRILNIPPSEIEEILATKAGKGLLKYGGIRVENELSYGELQVVGGFDFCVGEISDFQDDALKKRIEKMIISSVSALVELQSKLPDEQRFININQIKKGLLIGPGSQTLPDENMEQIKKKKIRLEEESNRLREEIKRLRKSNCEIQKASSHVLLATEFLHISLINNTQSIETLRRLKEQGADLKAYCNLENSYQGYTALHIAASTNNLMACRWLIEVERIDINILDSQGRMAIEQASIKKHKHIIDYLNKKKEEKEELTRKLHFIIDSEEITEEENSVNKGHLKMLNELIEGGADINGINDLPYPWRGDRPLHTLFVKGNLMLIRWAMEKGANRNLRESRHGETPYERLCRVSKNPGPVKAFLEQLNRSEQAEGKEEEVDRPEKSEGKEEELDKPEPAKGKEKEVAAFVKRKLYL